MVADDDGSRDTTAIEFLLHPAHDPDDDPSVGVEVQSKQLYHNCVEVGHIQQEDKYQSANDQADKTEDSEREEG
jgi:hypothetical protein